MVITEKIQKIVILVLILALFSTAGLAYYFYRQIQSVKQDPQKIAVDEIKNLVTKVGTLMSLPVGEDPVVATVTDPEVLKDQAFFAQAKKGDKVLIYSQAKKAILYDPLANKIIEVAPWTIGNQVPVESVGP